MTAIISYYYVFNKDSNEKVNQNRLFGQMQLNSIISMNIVDAIYFPSVRHITKCLTFKMSYAYSSNLLTETFLKFVNYRGACRNVSNSHWLH